MSSPPVEGNSGFGGVLFELIEGPWGQRPGSLNNSPQCAAGSLGEPGEPGEPGRDQTAALTGSEGVRTDEARLPPLPLVVVGQLDNNRQLVTTSGRRPAGQQQITSYYLW